MLEDSWLRNVLHLCTPDPTRLVHTFYYFWPKTQHHQELVRPCPLSLSAQASHILATDWLLVKGRTVSPGVPRAPCHDGRTLL
jgi:hypothetical protein